MSHENKEKKQSQGRELGFKGKRPIKKIGKIRQILDDEEIEEEMDEAIFGLGVMGLEDQIEE